MTYLVTYNTNVCGIKREEVSGMGALVQLISDINDNLGHVISVERI